MYNHLRIDHQIKLDNRIQVVALLGRCIRMWVCKVECLSCFYWSTVVYYTMNKGGHHFPIEEDIRHIRLEKFSEEKPAIGLKLNSSFLHKNT